MSIFVPRRVVQDELLDDHSAPAEDVDQSLVDLRRINRFAGGFVAYRRLLRRASQGSRPRAVLDVGTGSSDLLERVDCDIRIGVDFKIDHLLFGERLARVRVLRVVGDARRLPFRDDTVDIVASSHFFHHFSPAENFDLINEGLRVARVAVAATDTRRNIAPLFFVRIIAALRLVGRITRFDAPASVLQGYTMSEVRELGASFGRRFHAFRMLPFRFGLIVWK